MAAWPSVAIAERAGTAWGAAIAGVGGVALLAGGLTLRRPAVVTTGLALLGAGYGVALAVEAEPIDRAAPAFAAALFLCAELAWWSLELRARIAAEVGSYFQRLAFVLALGIGAFALGGALLAAIDLVRVDGLGALAAGASAAVAILAFVLFRREARA